MAAAAMQQMGTQPPQSAPGRPTVQAVNAERTPQNPDTATKEQAEQTTGLTHEEEQRIEDNHKRGNK